MYSLGIIFFELLRGSISYMERKEILERLRGDPPVLPKGFLCEQGDAEERQLLLCLLQHDATKRPTASEVPRERFLFVFFCFVPDRLRLASSRHVCVIRC